MGALWVVFSYLFLTVLIGIVAHAKGNSSRMFRGANLGMLMCVAAGAGEWMGGTSTTGVSEYGYLAGISGAWYTIANGLGILFCALLFSKLYRRLDTPTISGIVGYYIGKKAQKVSAVILIVVMLVVGISQMTAIGALGKVLFNMNITASIMLMGIIVIFYTLFGGMVSVGYTNTMHLVVMYVGMLLALAYCVIDSGGFEASAEQLPAGYMAIDTIGLEKIGAWVIASVLGACTAQAGIQPILAAKDEQVAFKSSIIIALIVAPFGLLTAGLGMYAKISFPELQNAKLALPMLIHSMPGWLSGLVMAAMAAAILSTAAPILLACGTLFTRDIYMPAHPKTGNTKELFLTRMVTAAAGLICILAAIALYEFSAILDIVYFAYSLRGSLFIVLLFGIYSRKEKLNETYTIVSMIVTAGVGLFWVIYKAVLGKFPISAGFSDTYAAVCTALISMGITKMLSRTQKKSGGLHE